MENIFKDYSHIMVMENINKDFSHIKGWGVDADPENDPTYPMKNRRTNEEHLGYPYQRPMQQIATKEILHSIERPNLSAVFGTAVPPMGLSGMIRRYAFRFSESSYAHWLPLVLADRVNVLEGVMDDLMHGKFPNFFAEKGGKARWKYNKKKILLNMLSGVGILGIAAGLLLKKNNTFQAL